MSEDRRRSLRIHLARNSGFNHLDDVVCDHFALLLRKFALMDDRWNEPQFPF